MNYNQFIKEIESFKFTSVIELPENYNILDLSSKENKFTSQNSSNLHSIGKYNELRAIYTAAQYTKNKRCIHMGLDIGAPVGTEVKNFYYGEVFDSVFHEAEQDYGGTLIMKYGFLSSPFYVLYGHLSKASSQRFSKGQPVHEGEVLGELGNQKENGGWPPHLHFQISLVAPIQGDLPGVVSEADREKALKLYPDPRLILGSLY